MESLLNHTFVRLGPQPKPPRAPHTSVISRVGTGYEGQCSESHITRGWSYRRMIGAADFWSGLPARIKDRVTERFGVWMFFLLNNVKG